APKLLIGSAENYCRMMIGTYSNDYLSKVFDTKHGTGSSEYIVKAFRYYSENNCTGSVKNFVALVKNGSFLVRITDMTILIEKEFIYGSSKRPNPTDYYRKQHYQCG